MPLFPPLVTGVVITSIGLSIIQVVLTGPPEVKGIRNMVIPFI
ncbi:putative transport protein [Escherichia coli]|uniref:Putative transport protein n=1 Tax=Escherichia coli TaxID=562 RepID=A0A2X1NBJ8_ECOLX|nr:putative transport protein [Escherichia coli]